MLKFFKALTIIVIALTAQPVIAQQLKGRIIDANTKEPVQGATICCNKKTCLTNMQGEFILDGPEEKMITVSLIGYSPMVFQVSTAEPVFEITRTSLLMNEVVLSANRDIAKRTLAPVAISSISTRMIQDAKPVSADQLLNKISGVYMVNLGNEQHSMSIRQPMSTKSLFLYLEDGIPIRTTGLFNHNALLEMNMAAVKSIEVIKGPGSSLYGSEAIGGVVNFITAAAPAIPQLRLQLQGNNIGYKRTDLQAGFTMGRWGFSLAGYYAGKSNGFMDYADFNKATLTARIDYHFSSKTLLSSSITWLKYYSDMAGSIDSAKFANRTFSSFHEFTYRKVQSARYRTSLSHHWSNAGRTTVSYIFRDNTIDQNPAYSVKDDYRFYSNSGWRGDKSLAHGEINEAGFRSHSLHAFHRQHFPWKKLAVITGLSVDLSPSRYLAEYIRIHKDSVSKQYTSFQLSDSILTHYKTNINNYAAFTNIELSPLEKLRVVASLRYDLFRYRFNNALPASAFTGSRDTLNYFSAISPKIGFTYNFSSKAGIYANYSEGFVPPQVTELYKGVKVPSLKPAVFYNYEIGGWAEIISGKLSSDISLYTLSGQNELVNVRLDDGSTEFRNTGKTMHKGIEMGFNANPLKSLGFRFTMALSSHRFNDFVEKGISYSGNQMNAAPAWMHNTEIWYRPNFLKGLRVGAEWQKLGSYFMDPSNTVKYEGYNVFHFRTGYKVQSMEIWLNIMNFTNAYYAYTSSKSSFGYSFTPAEPRNFNLGLSYDLASLLPKKNKS